MEPGVSVVGYGEERPECDIQDIRLMTGFLFDREIFKAAAARRVAGITGANTRLCLAYYEITYDRVFLCL